MSSEPDASPNGRERLITAGVRLFARDGFGATSVSALAESAGVSRGLIRFYFGSKEGLRRAVEETVMRGYLDRVAASARIRTVEDVFHLIDVHETGALTLADVTAYLRRAIVEERPMAVDFVARLLAEEPQDAAAALRERFPDETWLEDPTPAVSTKLGLLLAAPLFARLLGRDVFSVEDLKKRNADQFRILDLIRLGLESERATGKAKPPRV
ncbi:MAG TPA: helix-turn-helix domain-containing protein [Caulobacteraceae bacterium]|jgi:AcrR family transcriptional regulator|nr:helix-turn-helix domain-containing protein [Caulobacteraceae bacterium]